MSEELLLSKLDNIDKTVQKIDTSLNDDKRGLKVRVALLEQVNGFRLWRERIVAGAVIGIIIKLVFTAISTVPV